MDSSAKFTRIKYFLRMHLWTTNAYLVETFSVGFFLLLYANVVNPKQMFCWLFLVVSCCDILSIYCSFYQFEWHHYCLHVSTNKRREGSAVKQTGKWYMDTVEPSVHLNLAELYPSIVTSDCAECNDSTLFKSLDFLGPEPITWWMVTQAEQQVHDSRTRPVKQKRVWETCLLVPVGSCPEGSGVLWLRFWTHSQSGKWQWLLGNLLKLLQALSFFHITE